MPRIKVVWTVQRHNSDWGFCHNLHIVKYPWNLLNLSVEKYFLMNHFALSNCLSIYWYHQTNILLFTADMLIKKITCGMQRWAFESNGMCYVYGVIVLFVYIVKCKSRLLSGVCSSQSSQSQGALTILSDSATNSDALFKLQVFLYILLWIPCFQPCHGLFFVNHNFLIVWWPTAEWTNKKITMQHNYHHVFKLHWITDIEQFLSKYSLQNLRIMFVERLIFLELISPIPGIPSI